MNQQLIDIYLNKLEQEFEELEKSHMLFKKTLSNYEDFNYGYTTPKIQKSINSFNWSDKTTSPLGGQQSNYEQSIFYAPQKDFQSLEQMYESPKSITSLKFKLMDNTYTYYDNEEMEQQNMLKQKKKQETKNNCQHDFFQDYFKKKEQNQNDLRVILGLPIFDKED